MGRRWVDSPLKRAASARSATMLTPSAASRQKDNFRRNCRRSRMDSTGDVCVIWRFSARSRWNVGRYRQSSMWARIFSLPPTPAVRRQQRQSSRDRLEGIVEMQFSRGNDARKSRAAREYSCSARHEDGIDIVHSETAPSPAYSSSAGFDSRQIRRDPVFKIAPIVTAASILTPPRAKSGKPLDPARKRRLDRADL